MYALGNKNYAECNTQKKPHTFDYNSVAACVRERAPAKQTYQPNEERQSEKKTHNSIKNRKISHSWKKSTQ